MADPAPTRSYLVDAVDRLAESDAVLHGPSGTADAGTLADEVRRTADVLQSLGCHRGRIAAILTECPATACGAALATALTGAVPAVLHRGWFTRDLDTALAAVAPAFALADTRTADRLSAAAPIVLGTFSATGLMFGPEPPTNTPRPGIDNLPGATADVPDDGLIVFSAGTTGTPTAFHHGEPSLRSAAEIARSDTAGASRAVVTTDPSSSATLLTILELLAAGVSVEIKPRWTAKTIGESLDETVDLLVATAPRVHGLLATAARSSSSWESSGRRLITTGGPLMADLGALEHGGVADRASARFETAEVAGWVTERILDHSTSGAALDVLDLGSTLGDLVIEVGHDTLATPQSATGLVALDRGIGVLGVAGPRVAHSSVRSGSLHPLNDSTVRTGDLAESTDDGQTRWLGRLSDHFVCNGVPTFPAEQEAALARHPGVADVAVVARPDAVHGSIGVAVTVPIDPVDPPFLSELLSELDDLPAETHPTAQWITNSLPLTPDGRIQRRLLGYEEMTRGSSPPE